MIPPDWNRVKFFQNVPKIPFPILFSPFSQFQAEGELLERASLRLDQEEAELNIGPVLTTDEGEYKCEITFLDISKNCPVVQLVKLTTLASPKYANISLATGSSSGRTIERKLDSNSVVGPYNEGTDILLICESGGGKPIPQVSWFINNQKVPGLQL